MNGIGLFIYGHKRGGRRGKRGEGERGKRGEGGFILGVRRYWFIYLWT